MGLHAKLHKVFVRFHSRHHCKLGGSVKGEWIGNIFVTLVHLNSVNQPTYVCLGLSGLDLIFITYIQYHCE